MAYPAPFHRLVLIGTLYGDIFNTTLSFIPAGGTPIPAVTETLAEEVCTEVTAWFNDIGSSTPPGGPNLISNAILTSIKLNRIGTDGRYMDAETWEVPTSEPIPGLNTATPPPQLTLAATLRGSNPRALAGKGRMYLPPASFVGSVGADGRVTEAQATMTAVGIVTLIQNLNDVYLSNSVVAVAGIASKTRTGAFQSVETVTVGRTVDTIRSRRNKISEDFVSVSV